MQQRVETEQRPTGTALAALVRLPNLFTAPPDVVLGAALATAVGTAVELEAIAVLAVSSMLLYAGGTALNDAFDAPEDTTRRPERPIPSGEISRQTGFGLGALFLILGIASAVAATGATGGVVAATLAAGILLYDGVLKGSATGFATMGTIRGLNVVLGTTAGVEPLPLPWYLPAAVVTMYVAAVTFMAARETEGENRGAVTVAIVGTLLAAVAASIHLAFERPGSVATGVGLALVFGFLVWTVPTLHDAYYDPVPDTVGPAVGRCVLGIVILDAAFAAGTGTFWALGAVAFLAPAVGLAGLFDVT